MKTTFNIRFSPSGLYVAPGLRTVLVAAPRNICLTSFDGNNSHEGYGEDEDVEF